MMKNSDLLQSHSVGAKSKWQKKGFDPSPLVITVTLHLEPAIDINQSQNTILVFSNMNRDIPKYITIGASTACSDDDDYFLDSRIKPRSGITTDEFDLHENYHNAIEYLITCGSVIKSMQDKLDAKDEQLAKKEEEIETLKEKIVEMSLELASAKAVEDYHHLMKRRLSSSLNSGEVSTEQTNALLDMSLSSFNYTPSRNIHRRRNSSSAHCKESKTGLCRSWPGGQRFSLPNLSSTEDDVPKQRRPRGFRLSNFGFARSWGSLDIGNISSSAKGEGPVGVDDGKDTIKDTDKIISLDALGLADGEGQVDDAQFLPFPTRHNDVSTSYSPSTSENDISRQQDDASTEKNED